MKTYSLVAHNRRTGCTKKDSSSANAVSRLAEITGGRVGVRGAQKQKTAFRFWVDGRQWEGRYAVQRYVRVPAWEQDQNGTTEKMKNAPYKDSLLSLRYITSRLNLPKRSRLFSYPSLTSTWLLSTR